jgi:hypothetical protein
VTTPREDDRVETLLRASRPEPGGEFARRLEHRLLGAPTARAPRRRRLPVLTLRPALAGAGAVGILATAAVVASLAGAGPLGSGDEGARAHETCRYVTVRHAGRIPVMVQGKDGSTRLVYRHGTVTKRVKRCR